MSLRTSARRRRRRAVISRWVKGILLVVFLVGITVYTLMAPDRAQDPMTPERRQAAEQHMLTARQTLDEVRQAARAGKLRPFNLVVTDDDMNAFLETDEQAQKALQAHDIRGAYLHFTNGHAELSVKRGMVPGTAIVTPVAGPDGSLGFRLDDVRLGVVGMPGSVVEKARSTAEAALDASRRMFRDVHVKNLEVQEGKLLVTGDTR